MNPFSRNKKNSGGGGSITPARKSPPFERGGCCRGFPDCLVIGSIISYGKTRTNQPPSTSKFDLKVEELEKEVQKQRELKTVYKARLARAQEYMKYYLQVAKENGFLQLILPATGSSIKHEDVVDNHDQNHNIIVNRQTETVIYRDLESVIRLAKANGWHIDPSEIELHSKVARGSTSDIYKGTWRGIEVAVKWINSDFFYSNEELEDGIGFFAQEVEILSRQRHQNVLQLMGACLDPPNHAWIVTDFLPMALQEWLHGLDDDRSRKSKKKERTSPLPPLHERLVKALEISKAMQYLHGQKPVKVIHRDLKPSNIFLDHGMHVRVADFGHARFLGDNEKALTGETGTYVYMAPEVIKCEPYDEKCDVYSFGIILNELVTGQHPYIETDYSPSKIALQVSEGTLRPTLPENEDQELIELIRMSWDNASTKRPAFSTITITLTTIIEKQMVTK
ncbi:serine/threonine-protein kinase STY46-like [Impatiens glandulifera]|uniref:serine/threonine-protein kinase STY46-like n=1 Tax=Impatiens glandulifera TaxID=253017 RepID=UPI001FB0F237|nr:serine/threonine-protein kinase STY46-like [Impatiens glandulifera]